MFCLSDLQAFVCLLRERINIPTSYLQSRPADRSPISFLVFSTDRAAQSYSIKITSVFGQLVVLVKVWLNHVQKSPSSVKTDEELKQEVKNLGGYLQLLLQVKHIFWKKKT